MCFPDHLRRAANLARVAFGENLVARQMDGRNRRVVRLRLQNILGDVHQDWAGAAGRGDVESLVNHLRQIHDVLHQEIVLGAGARDAKRVGFLKRVAANELGGNLAGDRDHRDRIHQRIDQAGHQVRGARARGGAADADFSGRSRVALSRKRGVLLVPYQHVADGMIVEGIIERQRYPARIPEDAIYIFASQTFQQNLCAGHQLRFRCAARLRCSGRRHQSSKIKPKNQKATEWFFFPTRWPFGNSCPKPSSGAGYYDRNNNGPKLRNLTA